MKRRIFLKVSAAGLAYASMRPWPERWPMPDAVAPSPEAKILGFPVKVRPVGFTFTNPKDAPLTEWIPTFNNVPELRIEDLGPCTIKSVDVLVEFPELPDMNHECRVALPHPMYIPTDQFAVLVWHDHGIIEPFIDDGEEEFEA